MVAAQCAGKARKSPARRSKYTLRQKLEVVEYTTSNSVYRAAQHFNINRKSIIRWLRQVGSLRSEAGERHRLPGGGRKNEYARKWKQN
mgnify:CR=1 FL=1